MSRFALQLPWVGKEKKQSRESRFFSLSLHCLRRRLFYEHTLFSSCEGRITQTTRGGEGKKRKRRRARSNCFAGHSPIAFDNESSNQNLFSKKSVCVCRYFSPPYLFLHKPIFAGHSFSALCKQIEKNPWIRAW